MSILTDTPRSIPVVEKLGAFVELGKLRLSSLAIFAVLAGLYLGYPSWSDPPLWLTATTAITAIPGLFATGEADQRSPRTRPELVFCLRSSCEVVGA